MEETICASASLICAEAVVSTPELLLSCESPSLMSAEDSCHNRHRAKSLTNSKKARGDGYPNIFKNQEFPIVPRMGLTSNITYLRTDEGFMYHCVIRDIITGEVL